jgi:hypothetical protein
MTHCRDIGSLIDETAEISLFDGTLDMLVEQALSDIDPGGWIRARVQDAQDRLNRIDRSPSLKEEAKRQLFKIEQHLIRKARARDRRALS